MNKRGRKVTAHKKDTNAGKEMRDGMRLSHCCWSVCYGGEVMRCQLGDLSMLDDEDGLV